MCNITYFIIQFIFKSQWYTEWQQIDKNDTLSSHVKISLLSSLSLKLYLNSLVYHQNIFGSSSKVFGNLRKFSENISKERSSGLRNNFGKSSEIFGKWSEIFGKSSKKPSSLTFI